MYTEIKGKKECTNEINFNPSGGSEERIEAMRMEGKGGTDGGSEEVREGEEIERKIPTLRGSKKKK